MARCTATKRNGDRCTLPAVGKQGVCWAHDPQHAEQRRRRASRGGRGKAGRAVKELHVLLEDLTERVIDGNLETSRGAVANQLIGTRIRLFEYERRLKELQELEARITLLEEHAPDYRRGHRGWG